MPIIRTFLDISTAHLSTATRKLVDADCAGTTAYAHPDGYGWFIYVPEDADIEGDMPDDLRAVMAYARGLGCDYVLMDADALVDPALPTYNDVELHP